MCICICIYIYVCVSIYICIYVNWMIYDDLGKLVMVMIEAGRKRTNGGISILSGFERTFGILPFP